MMCLLRNYLTEIHHGLIICIMWVPKYFPGIALFALVKEDKRRCLPQTSEASVPQGREASHQITWNSDVLLEFMCFPITVFFYPDDLFTLFSLNVIDSLAHFHLHVTLGFMMWWWLCRLQLCWIQINSGITLMTAWQGAIDKQGVSGY